MRQSVAAELLVLRKRTATWILLVVWTLLAGLFSYLIPYLQDAPQLPLERLFPESLAGRLISGFPFFGGVFALILGVLSVGSEYGFDTLKTLFTQGPGRLRIFAAKLLALGIALVPFVVAVFALGAVSSYVIAQAEGAAIDWPSAGLVLRAIAAGWLILAVWAALGVLLGVLSRGTSLAIGIGILYGLVIEGLLGALAQEISALEPLLDAFLRTNGYSLAISLGASPEAIAIAGPGAFGGPFVESAQALGVLTAFTLAFLVVSAVLLRRRDVS